MIPEAFPVRASSDMVGSIRANFIRKSMYWKESKSAFLPWEMQQKKREIY